MEGSHFPPGQGTFRKIGVQFREKVAVAGYTPPFFGHGRVKVGVDQSAVSVSRCKRVGTLQCRFFTRVYPVVSFNLFFIKEHDHPLSRKQKPRVDGKHNFLQRLSNLVKQQLYLKAQSWFVLHSCGRELDS